MRSCRLQSLLNRPSTQSLQEINDFNPGSSSAAPTEVRAKPITLCRLTAERAEVGEATRPLRIWHEERSASIPIRFVCLSRIPR